MKQAYQIKLLFLVLFCFVSTGVSIERSQCLEWYQPPGKINRVFGLFKFGKSEPQDPRRIDYEKPLDDTDVFLMLKSFQTRIGVQPVEMGIVEILDGQKKVIWSGDLAVGQIARVDMRYAMSAAIAAVNNLPEAKTIRFRHTHPPGLKGHGVSYKTWKFSAADIDANRAYREALDKIAHTKELDLEVTIVYIDPNLNTFPTSTEAFQKICKTKAYRLTAIRIN